MVGGGYQAGGPVIARSSHGVPGVRGEGGEGRVRGDEVVCNEGREGE